MTKLKWQSGLGLVLLCALLLVWLSINQWIATQAYHHQAEIKKTLEEKLQFPIMVQTLETGFGLKPYVILNEVVILDTPKPLPFVALKRVKLTINPLKSLIAKTPVLDSIDIDHLKLVLGEDKQGKLGILSLNKEVIPSTIDIKLLLKALKELDQISLADAEIVWVRKNEDVIQKLEDINFWWGSDKKILKFKGKQSFCLENGDCLPYFPINFSFDLENSLGRVNTELLQTQMDCEFKTTPIASSPTTAKPSSQDQNHFECVATGRNIDIVNLNRDLKRFKPKEGSPEWLRWLLMALRSGNIVKGDFKIFGTFDVFDWQGNVSFEDLEFLYNSKWPPINHATGNVLIQKNQVKVDLSKGDIVGIPLKPVMAEVGPLADPKHSPRVKVSGSLSSSLEKGLDFLRKSPLAATVGQSLEAIAPQGKMNLDINLDIPLGADASKMPVLVKGKVEVDRAKLFIKDLNLPIEGLTGIFNFTEVGVNAKDLWIGILGEPFKVEIDPEKVTLKGTITPAFMQRIFKHEAFDYLPDSAQARLSVFPIVQGERKFSFNIPDFVDIKGAFGDLKKAQILRGEIALGGKEAVWPTQNKLSITGKVKELNATDIDDLLHSSTHFVSLPLRIDLMIESLKLMNFNFHQLKVSFDEKSQAQSWTLAGPEIKGTVILPSKEKSILQLKLDHLRLAGLKPEKNEQLTQEKPTSDFLKEWNYPVISMMTKDFQYDGLNLKYLAFRLQPEKLGYQIKALKAESEHFVVEGDGEWQYRSKPESSQLKGRIYSDNMGAALAEWGFGSVFRESRGQILYDFRWLSSPFEFSLKDTVGKAKISLKKGRIIGMNSGLGKILGLLSLDNLIKRRLQLDFSDLTKEGFVFDTLEAHIDFGHGLAITKEFNLDGPTASIKIKGQIDLRSKGVNLVMTVVPKVSGTLPLAATIASGGNPVVGAGAWLLDKILGKKLGQLAQHQYQVTGTWEAPRIVEMPGGGRR